MRYSCKPDGVCADSLEFEIEDGKISNVSFRGGCPGNHTGISRLVEGMDADEVVNRLGGIRCGMRSTSCPDQLARAVRQALEEGKADE
ncbi:MAG: TIGR03905 family TSCPD domain-containing protein [Clostridiales bacterium]|nr:TIGR03905 family TSCPD domain-containing protein [Clostridiales bacterium]